MNEITGKQSLVSVVLQSNLSDNLSFQFVWLIVRLLAGLLAVDTWLDRLLASNKK